MNKNLLTFLPILALSLIPARAIQITIPHGSFGSVCAFGVDGTINYDVEFNNPAFTVQTSAENVEACMNFRFVNDSTSASFTGNTILHNQGGAGYAAAEAFADLTFTLEESVNYSVSGMLSSFLREGGQGNLQVSFQELIPGVQHDIYQDFGVTETSGVLFVDNAGPWLLGSQSGILEPGTYQARFYNSVRSGFHDDTVDGLGGSAFGSFTLAMTANSVPDTGSTIMLLGMALCALGGFSREGQCAKR